MVYVLLWFVIVALYSLGLTMLIDSVSFFRRQFFNKINKIVNLNKQVSGN